MPVKPLSWSELSLFERSIADHHARYIDGVKIPATKEQEFGTIIHKTIENPKFPWLKELVVQGWPSAEQKIARKILDKIEMKRPKESEVYMLAETRDGIPLAAILDGFDKEKRELDEYKTSGGNYWSQTTVDQHGQLSFYALVYRLRYHQYFREIRLHRMQTKSGSVKTFYTARGPLDIAQMEAWIRKAYQEMVKLGIWNKRISTRDKNANLSLNLGA